MSKVYNFLLHTYKPACDISYIKYCVFAAPGMIELILTYLNFILAVALILWVSLLLVQKKESPLIYYIVVFNILMAFVLLYHWSFRSGVISRLSWMIYCDIPATFAIGPVVYLYMARLLGVDPDFRVSHLSHFIPALVSVCVLVILLCMDNSFIKYHRNNPVGYPRYGSMILYFLDAAADAWVTLYLLLSARKIRLSIKADRFIQKIELRSIYVILVIVAISYWGVWYAHTVNKPVMLAIVSLINGGGILCGVLFSHRYAEITQKLLKESRAPKKADPWLNSGDIDDIMNRLMELIEKENIYRDPGITLQSLSNMLGISSRSLSIVLNERIKLNFRKFINNYRLTEAMRRLAEEDEKTILEIAFTAGFNSKTSFNTLFSRETGLTPKEYRKKFSNKSTGPAEGK